MTYHNRKYYDDRFTSEKAMISLMDCIKARKHSFNIFKSSGLQCKLIENKKRVMFEDWYKGEFRKMNVCDEIMRISPEVKSCKYYFTSSPGGEIMDEDYAIYVFDLEFN